MLDLLTDWPARLPLEAVQSPKGIFVRGHIKQHQLLACSLSGNSELRSAFQAMRSNTHFDATSSTTRKAAKRFKTTSVTFPSTRYSELRGLILRRATRTPAL
jgi:hypothetical protein